MRGTPPDLVAEFALEAGLRLRAVRAITRRPAGQPCRTRRAACKGAVRLRAVERGHTGVVGRAVGIRRARDFHSGEEVGTDIISAGGAVALQGSLPGAHPHVHPTQKPEQQSDRKCAWLFEVGAGGDCVLTCAGGPANYPGQETKHESSPGNVHRKRGSTDRTVSRPPCPLSSCHACRHVQVPLAT